MDSGYDATTPLFMQHNGGFISPTRPLEFSEKKGDSPMIENKLQKTKSDIDRRRTSSIKSQRSTSNSSFITAPSEDLAVVSTDDNLLQSKPLIVWSHEEANYDLTPVLRRSEILQQDIITPKAEDFNTTFETVRTDDIGIDFSNSTPQPAAGLGIAKRNSAISINSFIEVSGKSKLSLRKTSPIKAIRTSMIINGQIDPTETLSSKEQTLNAQHLHNNSDNDESLFKDEECAKPLQRSTTLKKSSEMNLDDENYAYLFIIAIHSFDSASLKNPEDVSICLSFDKDDVAFVHTVDESGWGEVTLLKNAKRGWVPFNYFSDTVKSNNTIDSSDTFVRLTETRLPLQKLLSSSAKFLLHPKDSPLPDGTGTSFNVDYINGIRDGVKFLLEKTECVSRSNELVRDRPKIRKSRKVLLANWYNLMIKADYYKHTTNQQHIDTLTLLLFEVLRQAFLFFDVWFTEKKAYDEENEVKNKTLSIEEATGTTIEQQKCPAKKLIYLKEPPSAMNRLHEVYDLLFSYVGLILGRLDMIEHNPNGCETLEIIVHQMIILLRDLLYISKSCSAIIQERFQYAYENTLHKNLDPLLSLVSELVSCVKVLVTQTLQEDVKTETWQHLIKSEAYHCTDQGQRLTEIVASMTPLIANTINGCNSYLRLIGDIPLGSDRNYLDLKKIKMTPAKFINSCSQGFVKHLDKRALSESLKSPNFQKDASLKKYARFSTIRAGSNDELGFTYEGTQFLQGIILDTKPFDRDSTFEPYKIDEKCESSIEDECNIINNKEIMESEIILSKDGSILGASFRALVFKLTDELDKPDNALIEIILLNFHSFSTPASLIDTLIARFDLDDKSFNYDCGKKNGLYSSRSSRLKNRRKLVCKIFQTWMESYWDYRTGYKYLPAMINFFNEGVSVFLPLETKHLLETAAKLSALTPTSKKYKIGPKIREQLSPINTCKSRATSMYSSASLSSMGSRLSVFSLDEKIIEEYELAKLPSYSTSSVSLPLPVLNFGTSSLLSKRNIQDIERLLYSYRTLGGHHIPNTTNKKLVLKEDIEILLSEWGELVSSKINPQGNFIHNDLNLADLNPLELAKQLTLIESQLYRAIKPIELLEGNFLKKNRMLGSAPNVGAILDFTNELSNYVLESLLYPKITLKCRIARLKAWLKISLSTTYFRNYNSLASIMTALQNHAVTRLDDLWNGLDQKEYDLYEYLSRIVHPNNNFKVYRKKLKQYTEDNVTGDLPSEKSPVPVVPFFNLFLQDLTFIEEGNNTFRNPDSFRPHKFINLDKFSKVTKTINLMRYFQVNYQTNEPQVDNAHSFFNITNQIDVDTQRILPVPFLQEFILYEFWRVDTLYISEKDRSYQLSIRLSPRK